MSPLRARVEKGRLGHDEPTTLPYGTVIDLVADDEGDDLSDEERRALHDALSASWKLAEAGKSATRIGHSERAASASVSLPVRTTPESDAQIREIDDWVYCNRPAASDLFLHELAAAFDIIGHAPEIGRLYRRSPVPGTRRLLLARSRYHVLRRSSGRGREGARRVARAAWRRTAHAHAVAVHDTRSPRETVSALSAPLHDPPIDSLV